MVGGAAETDERPDVQDAGSDVVPDGQEAPPIVEHEPLHLVDVPAADDEASGHTEQPGGAQTQDDVVPAIPDGQASADDAMPDAPPLPDRVKWRLVFSAKAILLGIVMDVGFEIAMHQLGQTILTTAGLLNAAIEGAAIGIAAPSLGALVGAILVNRRLSRLEVPA